MLISKALNPRNCLFDANSTPLRNQSLALADLVLQLPHLNKIFFPRALGRRITERLVQPNNRTREDPRKTINRALSADCEHWQQILAQTREDCEVRRVDVRICGDERVIRDISMREFAADNIRVLSQHLEGRGRDLDVVSYAGVVVAAHLCQHQIAFPSSLSKAILTP